MRMKTTMTKHLMIIVLVMCGFSTVVFGDTKNGNANATSYQKWRIVTSGYSEISGTVTWTNQNVHQLHAVVTCSTGGLTGNYYTYASSAPAFDRVVNFQFGSGPPAHCTIFLTTTSGATSYRLSVRERIGNSGPEFDEEQSQNNSAGLVLIEDLSSGGYEEILANEIVSRQRIE